MISIWEKITEIDQHKFFINTQNSNIFYKSVIGKLKQKCNSPYVCNYLYIGSIYYMFSDEIFFEAIKTTDSVHLDGFAIGKVANILYKDTYTDFTSTSFIDQVFKYCESDKKKVFILGSYPGVKGIESAISRVKDNYPKLTVQGMDGYQSDDLMIKKINLHKPDLLVVGLGLKKQENWVYQHKKLLKTKVVISVGNYIDILAGRVKKPAEIYQKLHIRWLRRVIKEPKRLWRRYLGGIFYLALIIGAHYLRKKL